MKMYEITKNIVNRIKDWIEEYGIESLPKCPPRIGEYRFLTVGQIIPQISDLYILFGDEYSRLGCRGRIAHADQIKIIIAIHYNNGPIDYSIILHEVIHYFDYRRMNDRMFNYFVSKYHSEIISKESDSDLIQYFNDPFECNAFFYQTLYIMANKNIKYKNFNHYKLHFKEIATNHTYMGGISFMTRKSRRRMLSRLYKEWLTSL